MKLQLLILSEFHTFLGHSVLEKDSYLWRVCGLKINS